MNIKTLRKILVTLGQIFSYAVRHRYIDYNPLRDDKPQIHSGTTKSPTMYPLKTASVLLMIIEITLPGTILLMVKRYIIITTSIMAPKKILLKSKI